MSENGGSPSQVDVVVITGMSGSGRSTAINVLEDIGYYCIDNLPSALVEQFVALYASSHVGPSRVGLGMDVRDAGYVTAWGSVRKALEKAGHRVTVVFLDSSDEALIRRYSETRRVHPLGAGKDLPDAIRSERDLLDPLERAADLVIDTSALTVHDLKRRLRAFAEGSEAYRGPTVTLKSFGFKFGSLADAHLVFDVRFLPNPYFIPELKPLTGLESAVSANVLCSPLAVEFLDRTLAYLDFLLPHYADEGRAYVTVGIGCTGGKHRSVVLVEEIARRLRQRGAAVVVRHRDIAKESR
jgi:RNase adapter protein RapZ